MSLEDQRRQAQASAKARRDNYERLAAQHIMNQHASGSKHPVNQASFGKAIGIFVFLAVLAVLVLAGQAGLKDVAEDREQQSLNRWQQMTPEERAWYTERDNG